MPSERTDPSNAYTATDAAGGLVLWVAHPLKKRVNDECTCQIENHKVESQIVRRREIHAGEVDVPQRSYHRIFG